MQLFLEKSARRFVSLAILLFLATSFGVSVTGCKKAIAPEYCNAGDSGPQIGQVSKISLSPSLATTGLSLSYGQIGQSLSASGTDCKSNTASTPNLVYATSNMAIADINPTTGQVCAGSWNRNTGGGIADYTTCNPFTSSNQPPGYLAYVTATSEGVVSNAITVFIHPVVTGIVLSPPLSTAACGTSTDPTSNCCPTVTQVTYNPTPQPYAANACFSQGTTVQLAAKVYQNGTTNPADNITCKVGGLSYSAQTSGVASIDENGVLTAGLPGSSIISAAIANSSSASTAGFFSTCPPASISLFPTGSTSSTSINVSLNNSQPLTATVVDTKGVTLTGVTLNYSSTTPQTVTASSTITPTFPGSAGITAACVPPSCNPAPFSQIGYLGNGKPVTSNMVNVTTAGSSSTVIFAASTNSKYLLPYDFSTGLAQSLVLLPYVPNSMVLTQDGSTLYMGSTQGLMSLSTASNTVLSTNTSLPGTVLAVSPDGNTLVISDPTRQTISLATGGTSASVSTTWGGVGTRAIWTPDSAIVYITLSGGGVLWHSTASGWQTTTSQNYVDATMMVPAIGAYFAGQGGSLDGRSYCPSSVIGAGSPPTVTNTFAPIADSKAVIDDKVAATNDGKHILGAAVTGGLKFNDLNITNAPTGACPTAVPTNYFTSSPFSTALASITATAINGVIPSSNSALAFVTYTGSSALLPYYAVPSAGAGTVSYLTLGNGATTASAPQSGVFSTDNLNFYVGTGATGTGANGNSVDNDIHIFSITGTTPAETGILSPKLPAATGTGYAPINLMAQRPRKVTS